jgi:hypothetical protein
MLRRDWSSDVCSSDLFAREMVDRLSLPALREALAADLEERYA